LAKKLFLPFWLVTLAVLSGFSSAAPAYGQAHRRVTSQLQVMAEATATTPSVSRSPSQSDNQPLASSTAPNLRFDCLTAADGLSFSLVTSILQDQRGFMWFGTRYGLDKYDGNNFSVYLQDPGGDPMGGNFVLNLNQDQNGDLWIATSIDLVRWDMKTGEFVHYYPDYTNPESLTPGRINAFARDSDGVLLIGTNTGLNRYNANTDTFRRYLVDQPVLDIYVDHLGGIWLGTVEGLLYYSSGSIEQPGPMQYQVDRSDSDKPSSNVVTAIFEDRQGVLWVGTDGGGLNRLDRASGRYIPYASAENRSLNPDAPPGLSNDRVWSVLEDHTGRLWIATQDGLNLLDPTRENIYQYHVIPGDSQSLIDDAVYDLYQDRSGVVWVATFGGICRVNEIASRFTHYQQGPSQPELAASSQPGDTAILSDDNILSVYQDSHNILWVGTSKGGLNRLDRSTGSVTVYQNDPADPTSLNPGEVNAIFEDSAGTLWIGTSLGLNRFNPQTGTFEFEATVPRDIVGAIVEDQQGNLWVGSWEGLYRREPGASAFIPVSLIGGTVTIHRVQELYLDSRGALWIATQAGGLFRLDHAAEGGATATLVHFSQNSSDPSSPGGSPVMGIYEDPNGTIWMGTVDDGLVRFDRDTQTFVHFIPEPGTARDVTISRFVSCIQGDAHGYLWMGTILGLARFDPRRQTFSYYDARDGLDIGEVVSCFQSKQGEMFFGGWSGLNTFLPDQIQENPNPPAVVITALNLENQALRSDLHPDEQIKLPYQENYLSFDYTALDYAAPDKNQYAYKMEGLDTDWIGAGTRQHADYPDLKPGSYIFRVKASNNSGVWNEQGAAVQITITPPFWQTWWFLGLLGLALAGGIAGGIRLRLKGVEARSRKLETQVANRTRELVALNEIAAILNLPLDLQGVLRDALGKTLEVTRIEAGGIYLLDEKTQVLTIAAHQGFSPQFISEIDGLQVGEGFSGLVIQSGESLVIRDVSADPRLTRMVVREEGFHSLAVVPLKSRDQVRGTLFALTRGHREFTDQDIQLLESIGHQVGAAIENAGLYENTKNQVAQLTALQETAKAVASTLELDRLLNLIVQQATTLLQADGGIINLVDEDRGEDEVVAMAGLTPPSVGERSPLGGSLSGWVTLHNQAIISNQIPNDDRVARNAISWVMEEHIQSAAVTPLTVRDQVVGTLVVIRQRGGKEGFVQADLDLLVSFANQAAIAIENARLYEQSKELAVLEERSRLARELHDAVTQTLFSASLVAEALPTTWEKDHQEGRGLLQELRGLSRGALAEMRTLLLELRPAALLETSLADLVRQLGEAASGRTGIPISVQVEGQAKLPPDVHIAFYRIAQEALNNLVKHAHAHQATVRLDYTGGDLAAGVSQRALLIIIDDGRGFDPAQIAHNRLGLGIMKERARAISATLTIESQPGHGTQVSVLWEQTGRQEAK